MHNLSLYGAVPQSDHTRLLSQLAGVTRMQPQDVRQVVLVFKSKVPPGLAKVQAKGGTQGVQQQSDMQKLTTMLTSGLFFVHCIGAIGKDDDGSNRRISWTLDFKDTPEAGKQSVTSRLAFKIPITDGDPTDFMTAFGYDYVSSHYVEGIRFFDNKITLLLHRARQFPKTDAAMGVPRDARALPPLADMQLLDPSGSYILVASLDIAESNNQELRDRGIRQLLALKDTLKQGVTLAPADRLSLDTRIVVSSRP